VGLKEKITQGEKMKKRKKPADGYKSDEERMFRDWLIEAEEVDLIGNWTYEPITYDIAPKQRYDIEVSLKTKKAVRTKHLLLPLVFTPDFVFTLTEKGIKAGLGDVFEKSVATNGTTITVDVKGGGSKFHDAKYFSAMQKVVYLLKKVYVEKVVPAKFFPLTFAPEAWRYKKNGQINALGTRTLNRTQWLLTRRVK